jgi:hypothetical protein
MKKCTGATFTNRSLVCLAIAIAILASLFACRDKGPNTVVAYLQGADQQFENANQGREIEKALDDMLTLGPDGLRNQRYANYQMQPGTWTIIDVLHKYFLPPKPAGLDESRFYRDVTDPAAQAVIREHLREVREAIALDERASAPAAEEKKEGTQ